MYIVGIYIAMSKKQSFALVPSELLKYINIRESYYYKENLVFAKPIREENS